MSRKHLVLSVFVQQYGTHGQAWRRPRVKAGGKPSFERWADLVKLLERGKFDLAFFADFVGVDGDNLRGGGRRPRGESFEPLTLLGALSQVTTNIGLVATVNTNTNNPYNLARQLSSLDHLSGGRVGWNIVSSLQESAIKSFGIKNPLDHEGRYERASEFVELARKLWDSWDEDAFDHPDKESGQFYDPSSAHVVHHHGKHFDADTLLDLPRPLQGHPVFFQAGNSDRGREFAAQFADLIYAAAQSIEEAQSFYRDVKGRLANYNRDPDHLIVSPGLFYHIGESRQEAREKLESFQESVDTSNVKEAFGIDLTKHSIDGLLPDDLQVPANGQGRWHQAIALGRREGLTIRQLLVRFSAVNGHRTVIGTPVDIADQLEDWFRNGAADGFNLKPALLPDDLEDFIRLVVPELQRRGIFRTEYRGKTLRDHLALPPAATSSTPHLHIAARKSA
jgi:FMN-dependent oxidoreductase (nitrilotriacetate monooxygenase family)